MNKVLCLKPFQLLLLSSFLCTTVYAEITDSANVMAETESGQLKSLQQLRSLKSISDDLTSSAPYVVELPAPQGIRSLFVESQALPMVDIQLTFNAGSARDESLGKGLYGIANMTAKLLDDGTPDLSAAQIANRFEQLGAKLNVQAYRDMFVIRLRVLSDPQKLNPAVDLMLDLIQHSSFEPSGLNLILSNTNVGQKQLQENPERLSNIALYRAIYGYHPYAEPTSGTVVSTKKLTPVLLKQFRDTFLVAQNMNLAITGQLNALEAKQLSARIFERLPQGQLAAPLPDALEQQGFDVRILPYAATQAHVSMGHLSLKRSDPDVLALEVANQMLGGNGFNSALMKELRVKRGYTYGAYSSFSFTQSSGLFQLNYSTQQKQLLESIRVAHQTLINFVNTPIDSKQLQETKIGMLRAFPMSFSSNASINAQLGAIGFYGLPSDYLTEYPKALNAIKAEDIQHAIRRHIHPDRLTVIVAGQDISSEQIETLLKENLQNLSSSAKSVQK
ncbi:M16 family metallopeptidase [Acinetobacter soli]|uniref:M16 family metallopeptidase n=2 Tax=Acinetobacter soli TaxID=487316 RepID=UPI00124FA6B4|nr:pitrilysin family protein [Acinetobacter soli]